MPDFDSAPLTDQELIFLGELTRLKCRFILVGLAAAVVQGADTVTQDLDLWFELPASPAIGAAAAAAGGFYSSRTQPPMVGGKGLERIDIVTHCHGLGSFDEEYASTVSLHLADYDIAVLKLDRILVSKTAADRPKDRAVLEQLRAALAAVDASR